MKSAWHDDPHWTDEQIIAGLYDVGPKNEHLDRCEACKSRRCSLIGKREELEAVVCAGQDVSFEFLTRQRRAIYAKLEARSAYVIGWRRWAAVALTVVVLGSGAAVYHVRHVHEVPAVQLSDAQLALEVSRMSQEWQAEPAAPLQGLFE